MRILPSKYTNVILIIALLTLEGSICFGQEIDINTLTNSGCFTKIDELFNSNLDEEIISQALSKQLRTFFINRINAQCIYHLILHVKDGSLMNVFKERMYENNEINRINEDYLYNLVNRNNIPEQIIEKLSVLKGKIFFSYEEYRQYLNDILTQEEYFRYWRSLVFGDRMDPLNYSADFYWLLKNKSKHFHSEDFFVDECLKLRHVWSYNIFFELHINDLPLKSQLLVLQDITEKRLGDNSVFLVFLAGLLEKIYKADPVLYEDYIKNKEGKVPPIFLCVFDNTCP